MAPPKKKHKRKSQLQKQLELSIKLAQERMLPSQLRRDSLGRRLRDVDADIPTSLDDPGDLI